MNFIHIAFIITLNGLTSLSPRSCPPGCLLNGNCNKETGTCECNLGFKGPSCEETELGACRSSASSSVIGLGKRWPKSCLCWQQIFDFSYIKPHLQQTRAGADTPRFRIKAGSYLWNNVDVVHFCYERVEKDGKPSAAHLQLSDIPFANDSRYRFLRPMVTPGDLGSLLFVTLQRLASITVTEDSVSIPLLPLDHCEARCNDRGACYGDQPAPRCVCRKGFKGTSCSEFYRKGERGKSSLDPGSMACPNSCSASGSSEIKCYGGWCKCPEAQWGSDCGRSLALTTQDQQAANSSLMMRSRVLIYKYDLPWHVSFPFEFDDGWGSEDRMYSSEFWFNDLLTADEVHYTKDINKANLFYIPLNARHYGSEAAATHIGQVMSFIRVRYPSTWGRRKGRDHFMWLTDDSGACGLTGEDVGALVSNPIKIVHFGLHRKTRGYANTQSYDNRSCFTRNDILATCSVMSEEEVTAARLLAAKARSRRYLLYFGGSWRLDQLSYSGGARQAYYKHIHLQNDSRVKFGGSAYHESQFCFIPYGEGWGNRLPLAVLHGCLPVIVQDKVHNEFFDIIPFEEFAIRLSVDEVPMMLEILSGIAAGEIDRMRSSMARWERSFYWGGDGLAYNQTLKSLHKRLYGLWALNY